MRRWEVGSKIFEKKFLLRRQFNDLLLVSWTAGVISSLDKYCISVSLMDRLMLLSL